VPVIAGEGGCDGRQEQQHSPPDNQQQHSMSQHCSAGRQELTRDVAGSCRASTLSKQH
jgi:hypothetical protein